MPSSALLQDMQVFLQPRAECKQASGAPGLGHLREQGDCAVLLMLICELARHSIELFGGEIEKVGKLLLRYPLK